jgi:hypothetical protein
MIIRESDLTAEAKNIGIWTSLCEMAGYDNPADVEEINIDKVSVNENQLSF